jgi:hypothetical protein
MKLGDFVRDKITGFEGVATGVAKYITGCTQWLVTSKKLKPDGDTMANWLDEVRLEPGVGEALKLAPAAGEQGGPSLGPSSAVQAPPVR